MKKLVACSLAVACLSTGHAQLLVVPTGHLSMAFVLLNVTSARAHADFWVTQFDARRVKVGKLDGVTIPGVVMLFREQPRTGPGEGETINHLGLKLLKLSDYTARFEKGGWKYDPPRIGREQTPQTYVTGPDTFRMELVEDPRLPAPVIAHHLHYWMEDPPAVKKWYVDTLGMTATMRGPYPSADVPGMNFTFAPLGSQKGPGVPTKGRLMDSIGVEVTDLAAYAKELARKGVKFDAPYGVDPDLVLPYVTLTDPWGVTMKFTNGIARIAGVAPFTYVDGFVEQK